MARKRDRFKLWTDESVKTKVSSRIVFNTWWRLGVWRSISYRWDMRTSIFSLPKRSRFRGYCRFEENSGGYISQSRMTTVSADERVVNPRCPLGRSLNLSSHCVSVRHSVHRCAALSTPTLTLTLTLTVYVFNRTAPIDDSIVLLRWSIASCLRGSLGVTSTPTCVRLTLFDDIV